MIPVVLENALRLRCSSLASVTLQTSGHGWKVLRSRSMIGSRGSALAVEVHMRRHAAESRIRCDQCRGAVAALRIAGSNASIEECWPRLLVRLSPSTLDAARSIASPCGRMHPRVRNRT